MSRDATLPARAIVKILDTASEAGVDDGALRAASGIEDVALDDPSSVVTLSQVVRMYEEGAKLSGDGAFGLHVGERWKPDIIGYTAMSGRSFRDAFEVLGPYLRAVHGGEDTSLTVDGGAARFTFTVDPALRPCRHRCEAYLVIVLRLARAGLGIEVTPSRVRFQHERPADIAEHTRLFSAPVEFDQPVNELVFDAELLARPLVSADAELSSVLESHIQSQVEKLDEPERLRDRVRLAILGALGGGDPSIEAIARQLGIARRTLQRRLKEEGTSHQELLDDARRELALRYLAEDRLSVKEIAFLLGYADNAAFHRAFKRWTGTTPLEHRRGRPRGA